MCSRLAPQYGRVDAKPRMLLKGIALRVVCEIDADWSYLRTVGLYILQIALKTEIDEAADEGERDQVAQRFMS